jgi:hypothetical protein
MLLCTVIYIHLYMLLYTSSSAIRYAGTIWLCIMLYLLWIVICMLLYILCTVMCCYVLLYALLYSVLLCRPKSGYAYQKLRVANTAFSSNTLLYTSNLVSCTATPDLLLCHMLLWLLCSMLYAVIHFRYCYTLLCAVVGIVMQYCLCSVVTLSYAGIYCCILVWIDYTYCYSVMLLCAVMLYTVM